MWGTSIVWQRGSLVCVHIQFWMVLPHNTCLGQAQIKLILERAYKRTGCFAGDREFVKKCREQEKGLEIKHTVRKRYINTYNWRNKDLKPDYPLTQLWMQMTQLRMANGIHICCSTCQLTRRPERANIKQMRSVAQLLLTDGLITLNTLIMKEKRLCFPEGKQWY